MSVFGKQFRALPLKLEELLVNVLRSWFARYLRLEKCEVRCENGHGIVLEGESAELTTELLELFKLVVQAYSLERGHKQP